MRDIQKYDAKPVAAFNQYLPHGAAAAPVPHVPVPLRKKRGDRPQTFHESWTDSRAPPGGTRVVERSRSMIDVGGGRASGEDGNKEEDEDMSPEDLTHSMAQQKQQYEQLRETRHRVQENDQAWQSSLAEWKSRRISTSEKLLQKLSEHMLDSNGDHAGGARGGHDGGHSSGGESARGGGRGGFYGNNGFDEDDDNNIVYSSSSSRDDTSSLRRPEVMWGREEVSEARRDDVDGGERRRDVVTTSLQASATLPRTSVVSKAYVEAPKPSTSPSKPAPLRSTETKPGFSASQAPRKDLVKQQDSWQSLPHSFKAEAVTSYSRPPEKPSEAQPESVKSYNRTVQGWKALEAQSFKATPAATAAAATKGTSITTPNVNTYNTTVTTTRRSYGSARAEHEMEDDGWTWRPSSTSVRRAATPPTPPPRKPDSSGLAVNRLSQRAPLPVSVVPAALVSPPAATTLVSPGATTSSLVTVTLTKSSPPPSIMDQGFAVSKSRSYATDKEGRPAVAAVATAAPVRLPTVATSSISNAQKVITTSNGDASDPKKNQWHNARFFGFSEDSDDVHQAAEQEKRKQEEEELEEERRWLERRRLEGAVSWTAYGGHGGHNGGLGGGQNRVRSGGAQSDEDDKEAERIRKEIEEEERRWNERKRLERTSSSGSSPTKPGPWSPTVPSGPEQCSMPAGLPASVNTDSRSATLPRLSPSASAKYNPYGSLGRSLILSPHYGSNLSYRDPSQMPSSYRSSSSHGRQMLSPTYRNFSSNSVGSGSSYGGSGYGGSGYGGSGYGGSGYRGSSTRFISGSPSYSATYSINYGAARSPGYGARSFEYGARSPGYGNRSPPYGGRSPTYSTALARSPSYGSPAKISGEKKECGSCGNAIGNGAAMFIDSLNLFFHIDCFKCEVCSGSLGDACTGMDVRMLSGRLHCSSCYFRKRGSQPVSDL